MRTGIVKHENTLPREFVNKVRRYLARAESFSSLELPRTIIHSDVTWDNVLRNKGVLVLIDLEGAGIAPAVMDLVEVTTKLSTGHSASGPLDEEATFSFYRGYRKHRNLTEVEIEALPEAHVFHELYYLANSLQRGDLDYIRRMEARLQNWEAGAFEVLAKAAAYSTSV